MGEDEEPEQDFQVHWNHASALSAYAEFYKDKETVRSFLTLLRPKRVATTNKFNLEIFHSNSSFSQFPPAPSLLSGHARAAPPQARAGQPRSPSSQSVASKPSPA